MFWCLGLLIFFMILLVDDLYWLELGMMLYNIDFDEVK